MMRTKPATSAEADAWITVLLARGHLHRADQGPDGTWTVQRTPHHQPRTLHHPAFAIDYVAEVLLDIRHQRPGAAR